MGPAGGERLGVFDGFDQAALARDALAGDVEGGAVTRRGADERQTDEQRHHRPEAQQLHRAQTLIVKQELYVDAARVFGASVARILWKHVVPNAIQPVIVQVTLLLAVALLAEASLSFLGLGIQPPNPSWGAMLARAYQYMEIAPEQMYAPGLAILVVSLAFNALGESLRIVLDPTMRDR